MKDIEYWEGLRPTNGVLLLNRRDHNHLHDMVILSFDVREHIPVYPTKEVKEWLDEHAHAGWTCYVVSLDPSEVPNGEHELEIARKWNTTFNKMIVNTYYGSMDDLRPAPTKAKRVCFVFENQIDAIHFKLRWIG